jgi:predicted phosphodiesterase
MGAILLVLLASFPLRVAVMGDRSGSPDDTEFQIAVAAIETMSPDIVLSVGDYVEGYGEVRTAVDDWEHVMPVLERLTCRFPFIFVPGNNDIWNDETREYWLEYTGVAPSRIDDVMGVKFVVWDSSIPNSLGDEQLEEIDSLTAGLNGEEPWIFVTHKPFWFMSYQDSAQVDRFMEMMRQRQPLAVVGGHIHLFASQRIDGILYVSAGPSGSAVPEPEPERGDFTQLGWMTVWEDSVHLSVIDARGVYSESLNTGDEMDLAYRYQQELLRPRPLEPGLESAILALEPVEDEARTVLIQIDPGGWGLDPLEMRLDSFSAPQELVFSQNPSGSPYPSPVITVSLKYGDRHRDLTIRRSWQILRRANAFSADIQLDGIIGDGEYRDPMQRDFADFSGQPSEIRETGFAAANDSGKLVICADMEAFRMEGEDFIGLIMAGKDGSFLWIKLHSDGREDIQSFTSRGDLVEVEEGIDTALFGTTMGWSAEIAIDMDLLEMKDNHVLAHVYRSAGDDFGTWIYPIDFDTSTMGMIWIEPEH